MKCKKLSYVETERLGIELKWERERKCTIFYWKDRLWNKKFKKTLINSDILEDLIRSIKSEWKRKKKQARKEKPFLSDQFLQELQTFVAHYTHKESHNLP